MLIINKFWMAVRFLSGACPGFVACFLYGIDVCNIILDRLKIILLSKRRQMFFSS